MDTAWIQVFVLTLVECVAPSGKTVCQQQELEMTFLTQADCQQALQQLVTLKDAAENIIVDKAKTRCETTARRQAVFTSLAEVSESAGEGLTWRAPDHEERVASTVDANYKSRLETIKTCDETNGVAPCKIGEIIIEDAVSGEPVEIWRRDSE